MTLSYAQLKAWDHAHLWHPFTQMQDWLAEDPVIIARGEGNYLVDVYGNKYLDGVSSLWCNVHGHNHPEINAAITAQLAQIAHSTLLGLANIPAILLAKKLVELAPPGLTRVFYSDAGATAVEIALKLAFQYWQLKGISSKVQFASLVEAYHGDTLGAMGVGYSELFHHSYRPLLTEAFRLTPPHCFRFYRGLAETEALTAAVEEARRGLFTHRQQIAALIVEPRRIVAVFEQLSRHYDFTVVEGAGGLLVPLVGRYTFADLAYDLSVPLLVVVGSKLGALNHTLLTLHCAQALSLPVVGYMLNHPTPVSDLATRTNAQTLARLTDVPCLGILPFLSLNGDVEQDRMILCDLFSRAVDLASVLR